MGRAALKVQFVGNMPRFLRRYQPDQVPRDFLNPV